MILQRIHVPVARFHVTEGFGNPSALHSTAASEPCANALSVGSNIHLGGTKNFERRCNNSY